MNNITYETLKERIPIKGMKVNINDLIKSLCELNRNALCNESGFQSVEIIDCKIYGKINPKTFDTFLDLKTHNIHIPNDISIVNSEILEPFEIPMVTLSDSKVKGSFIFSGNIIFSGVIFRETFSIENTRFLDDVTFDTCVFEENVIIFRTTFKATVFFSQNEFKEVLQITSSEFTRSLAFIDMSFHKGATFSSVQFFGKSIMFLNIQVGNTHLLDLYEVEIADMALVTFTEMPYDQLRVRWKQLKRVRRSNNRFSSTLYTIGYYCFLGLSVKFSVKYLEHNFHFKINYDPTLYYTIISKRVERGRYASADDAFYEFRKRRRLEDSTMTRFDKWRGWMCDVWCGYGIKPCRLIFLMSVLLFGFTSIFSWEGALNIEYDPRISVSVFSHYFTAFYFSAITFFTIGYGDITPSSSMFFRAIAIVCGFSGWVCLTLLMVFFARKFIR